MDKSGDAAYPPPPPPAYQPPATQPPMQPPPPQPLQQQMGPAGGAYYQPQQPGYQPQQPGYQPQQPGYQQQPGMMMQQQQPATVIVTQPQTMYVAHEQRPSHLPPMVISCFVIWCCWGGFIPGLIAFILAIMAGSEQNAEQATAKVKWAYICIGIGVTIGLIIWIVLIAV